jgi:DNA-binding winged helix-turn-helix (wHTH) protein/Tfp pilus assembly protein PilF
MNMQARKMLFQIDLDDERLWRGTEEIPLPPKAFTLLRFFLQHPDRLLTKHEILEKVWPNTYVTEGLVKDYVRDLRKALGDDPKSPRFIKTVHRRGYRYIGHITLKENSAARTLSSAHAIAVLPFTVLNSDGHLTTFCDALVDTIIAGLCRFPALLVIAHRVSSRYRNKTLRTKDVATDLGVRYLLEGSLEYEHYLTIHVQLVDTFDGHPIWQEHYHYENLDLLTPPAVITRGITSILNLTPSGGLNQPQTTQKHFNAPTQNLEAYDCLRRGILHLDRLTKTDNRLARNLFDKAIELDPNYTRAVAKNTWTYLADYIHHWQDRPEQSLAWAHVMAQRAVAMDPTESWTHWALASVYLWQKRYELAIEEYHEAYKLTPNDADIVIDYGWGLACAGFAQEGIQMMRGALRLDPSLPESYLANLGQGYFMAQRYSEAIAILARLPCHQTNTVLLLAASYAQVGKLEEAQATLTKIPQWDTWDKRDNQRFLARAIENHRFKNPADIKHFQDALYKVGLATNSQSPTQWYGSAIS